MATPRICSIPDCDKAHYGHGLCNQHYQCWRKTGAFDAFIQRREIPSKCSVEACDGDHYSRGFCSAHYGRLMRHGDPLAGRTRQGEPLQYIESVVLKYEGGDCLIWPFHKSARFYGMVSVGGKRQVATRYICTRAHGEPPTLSHYAAHSCGKGHLGCVTKFHLSWKTPSENEADKLVHGTDSFGEKSRNAKLSNAQVREIRGLIGTLPKTEIGRMFGVSGAHIVRISKNQTRVLG